MSLFFRREKEVRALIQEYFLSADKALDEFEKALKLDPSIAFARDNLKRLTG